MNIPVTTEIKKITNPNGKITEVFPLPTDEKFLFDLLKDIFETYWDKIIFGPIIDGAAYEMRCPQAPTQVDLTGGYLTIFFGVTHFHICIGINSGGTRESQQNRTTQRAEYYRDLDKTGAPVSWGFRMYSGAGDQQLTILFPNPFVSECDKILDTPDWSRLSVWNKIQKKYFNRSEDPKDFTANGFANM